MKKKLLVAAMALLTGSMLTCETSYAIEEDETNVQVETKGESYRIFGEAKKNSINTLDNYIDNLETSSIDIDKYTREDIEKQNSPTLGSILQQSAGVIVNTSNGSDGNISKVRMRGTDRVRIQIDGLRADRTTGIGYTSEIQYLETDDLESIEVIKGPQGSVLGTNALGGSVNMTTRRGKGPFKAEFGQSIGQYGTFKERAAVMGEHKGLDYYISTTFYKTSGGMRTNNLGRLYNDGYRNFNLVTNIGYKMLDDKAELRNIFRMSNAKKGLPIGYAWGVTGAAYNDPNNYVRNFDVTENLSWKHQVNDYYDYSVRFGIYQNNNYNYDTVPDELNPIGWDWAKYRGNRMNFITQHNVNLTDWNKLSIGYNFEQETSHFNSRSDWGWGATDGYSNEHTSLQNDVYISDSVNIKDIFFLRGGVRYMHNNRYGEHILPNGSAAVVLPTFKINGAKTKFRGSWGQSVNNPSPYQKLMTVPSWGLFANPGLNSEKLTGWDAGIEQSFFDGKLKFDFGYFHNDYKNYIDWQVYSIAPYQAHYANIYKARIYGYEGKAIWEPSDYFKLVLNYTYTDSEDKSTGYDLAQSPNNTYSATIYATPFKDRWDLYAGLTTTSSRRAAGGVDADNRVKPIYDAKIGTKLRLFSWKGLHTYLRADVLNLFNQNNCVYREGNVFYYSPKIHTTIGLFVEYDDEKQKRIDEAKKVRAELKEQKRLEARQKMLEKQKQLENL